MYRRFTIILSLLTAGGLQAALAQTPPGTAPTQPATAQKPPGLAPAPTGAVQTDSGTVTVHKDARIDDLVRKQIQINEETTRDSRRNMPGFRIQVINSTDRNKVFAAKTKIYQDFPDLKPYLLYQAPNYKLRVGNFKTQDEAEEMEKQLARLFPSGLFVIRDTIEVNPNDVPLPNNP